MIVGWDASRVVEQGRTGTETYSREMLRHMLPRILTAGDDVRLYTRVPLPARVVGLETWPPAVQVRPLGPPRLWTHVGLAADLWRDPPHVLFIPAHVVPLLPPRIPIVVTVHDLGFEHVPEAHPRGQRWYLRWSTLHSARKATHILADSQATAQDLERLYRVPRDKITVVYPGYVQLPAVSADDVHAVRRQYGLHFPYILHLGTIQPRKNVLRLLDAFARLGEIHAVGGNPSGPVHLVLAGKVGWLAEPILRRAAELGGRVHVLGYVPDAWVPALLAAALALAFPSLYEGFGFPVLEAQSMGVPVLVSRVASLPEVAGNAAVYVDPWDVNSIAEGLHRLITRPDVREELAKAGKRNVVRFSWDRAAQEAWDIIQHVGRKG